MVDPLALLARIERRHLIFLVIGLFVMQSFAMVMTADLAVVAALDIATYVDAALTVWTVAALTRIRGAGAWTAGWLRAGRRRGLRPTAAQRMPRRHRLPMPLRAPANDDEDGPARPLAA